MIYKNIFIPISAFILIIFSSCGIQSDKQDFDTEKSYHKGQSALTACKSIRIPRDIEFSGAFLYKFLSCLTENDLEGNEKFEATNKLIKYLGEDGLEQLTKILLYETPNKDGLGEDVVSYPLLRAARIFVERGLYKGEASIPSSDLHQERLVHLQDFFQQLYPKPLARFFLNLNNEGSASLFLQNFKELSASDFPSYASAFFNLQLHDEQLQGHQYQLLSNFFNSKNIILPLDKMLTIEQGKLLTEKSKLSCLGQWLTPALEKIDENCIVQSSLINADGPSLYKNIFLNTLSDNHKNELINATSTFQKSLIDLDHISENLDKWREGIQETFKIQVSPFKHLAALLNFYTESGPNGRAPKVSDLEEIIVSMEEILSQSGPRTLLSLNIKIGSAKLHQYVENKIIEGGAVKSCPGLELLGLKEGHGPSEFETIFKTYEQNNELCVYHLPPIYSIALDYIAKSLDVTFPCASEESDACISDENLKRLSNVFKNSTKRNHFQQGELSSEELKDFTLEALDFLIEKQNENRTTLHELNLGSVDYSINSLIKIRANISKIANLTPKILAQLDLSLESPSPHFFEELLAYYLRQAKNYLSPWQGLFSDKIYREQKARILTQGINPGGYFERLGHEVLKVKNIPTNILNKISKGDFTRLQSIMQRLQNPGNFFKNQMLDPYDSETPWFTLGQEKRSVEFHYKKVGSEYHFHSPKLNKDALSVADLFSVDLWKIESNIAEDVGLSKDISQSTTDTFLKWFQTDYYNFLASTFSWVDFADEFNPEKPFVKLKKYISSESYSLKEKRAFALFISKSFLMASDMLPKEDESYSIEKTILKRRPDIRANFLSLPAEENKLWESYLTHFPEELASDNLPIEQVIQNSLSYFTKENWEQIEWDKLPIDKRGQRELEGLSGNSLKIVEILSNLQLLTVNSQGKFMPFVGLNGECQKAPGQNYNCPLIFKSYQSRNGQEIDASRALKDYLYQRSLTYFCPYIVKNGPFGAQLNQKIQEELKIVVRDEATRIFCKDLWEKHNLVIKEEEGPKKGLPFKSLSQTITSFFELSKNPQLPKKFSSVISKIAFYKDLAKSNNNIEMSHHWLNSPQENSEEINEYLSKVVSDHKGFYSKNPGMLNAKLYFMSAVFRQQSENYDHAIWRLGVNLSAKDDLNNGDTERFLEEILIPLYKNYKNPDDPILYFVKDLIKILNRPENKEMRESLSLILAYPRDIETYPTFSKTLPLFLNHFYFKFGSERLWTIPALELIRPFLFQENFRAIGAIAENFSASEVSSFFNMSINALDKFTGSGLESISLKINKLCQDFLLRLDSNDSLYIDFYKENLLELLNSDFISKNSLSIDSFLKSLAIPHKTLGKTKSLSFYDSFNFLNKLIMEKTPDLLSIYQNRLLKYEDELKVILLNIMQPFKDGKIGQGANALASLLADPEIPNWHDLFHGFIFEQKSQENYLKLASNLNKLPAADFADVIKETGVLLPNSHNVLNYLVSRIKWRTNLSTDAKMALHSLNRLSIKNNEILEKQLQTTLNWLQNEANLQKSNNVIDHP